MRSISAKSLKSGNKYTVSVTCPQSGLKKVELYYSSTANGNKGGYVVYVFGEGCDPWTDFKSFRLALRYFNHFAKGFFS